MIDKTLAEICKYHQQLGSVDRVSIQNMLGAVQAKIKEHDAFLAEYKVSYLSAEMTQTFYGYIQWAEAKLSQTN